MHSISISAPGTTRPPRRPLSRWRLRREKLAVNAVHRLKVRDVGEEHRALGNVGQRDAGEGRRRLDVLERLTSGLDAAVGGGRHHRAWYERAERNTEVADAHRAGEHAAGPRVRRIEYLLLPPCAAAVWFVAARASSVSDAIRRTGRTRMIEPRSENG
jgi:hypothetical protein